MVTPKVLRPKDLAVKFSHSVPWFYRHRKRLEQLGFPPRDNALDGWNTLAVDSWFDNRAKLITQSSEEAQMLEILHGTSRA